MFFSKIISEIHAFKPNKNQKQEFDMVAETTYYIFGLLQKHPIHCLRPILHIACPNSMLSYSKGSRGLFVPSRVIGIFTDTTISLSSRLRQRPDHYTIRAGRNLPDKEFRYLRTVIVTAAVYWGFNSTLLSTMTSPLNLPAPGRCQAVYRIFRFSTALCFC